MRYTVQVYYGPSSRLPGDKHWQDVVHHKTLDKAIANCKMFAKGGGAEFRVICIMSPIFDDSDA